MNVFINNDVNDAEAARRKVKFRELELVNYDQARLTLLTTPCRA